MWRNTVLSVFVGMSIWAARPLAAETIPSGTELVIRLDRQVEPRSKDQKEFSASLALPVFSGGREVVPVNSRIEGEVRGSSKEIFLSPRTLILPDGRRVEFTATVSAISNKKLKADGSEGTIQESGTAGQTAKQAGEIGVTGAEIGAMSTGTAMGAGIGAAAGVAAVIIGRKIAGHHHTTVIPAGTQLTLNLSQALEIPDDAANPAPPASEDRGGDHRDARPILRRADGEQLAAASVPE